MDLYIDSANVKEIDRLLSTGLFAGVTCNPGILEKDGVKLEDLASLFQSIQLQDDTLKVFFQTWGSTGTELYKNSQTILEINPSIVVKVPATPAGLPVSRKLVLDGNNVLLTAVYDCSQAVLATAMGVQYIAPYFGRMNDNGIDALSEISMMQKVINSSASDLQIVAASLRSPREIVELAAAGIQGFTTSPSNWDQVFAQQLSIEATENFERNIQRLM